jgi:hypothetical protein
VVQTLQNVGTQQSPTDMYVPVNDGGVDEHTPIGLEPKLINPKFKGLKNLVKPVLQSVIENPLSDGPGYTK